MERLSDELIHLVFSFLAPVDLLALTTVCKRLAAVALDNSLWRRLYLSHFTLPTARVPVLPPRHVQDDRSLVGKRQWKQLYALQSSWTTGNATVSSLDTQAGRQWAVIQGDGSSSSVLVTWQGRNICLHLQGCARPLQVPHLNEIKLLASEATSSRRMLLLLASDDTYHLVRLAADYASLAHLDSFTCSTTAPPGDAVAHLALYGNYMVRYMRSARIIVTDITTRHDVCSLRAPITPGTPVSLAVEPLPSRHDFCLCVAFVHQAYTPPHMPEAYTVRVQTFHFVGGALSASNVYLPDLDAAARVHGPFDDDDDEHLRPTPPVQHSPITLIQYTTPYVIACHADDTMSVYGLFATASPSPSAAVSPWIRKTSPQTCTFLTTLHGHTAGVTAVAASEMGRIVSVSRDGSARVWQLEPWIRTSDDAGSRKRTGSDDALVRHVRMRLDEDDDAWVYQTPTPRILYNPSMPTPSPSPTRYHLRHLKPGHTQTHVHAVHPAFAQRYTLSGLLQRHDSIEAVYDVYDTDGDDTLEPASSSWASFRERRVIQRHTVTRIRRDECVSQLRLPPGPLAGEVTQVHFDERNIECLVVPPSSSAASRIVTFSFR
ncbi:hypothetical protein RI367_001035 [Sorochytrium milnesiophthora]